MIVKKKILLCICLSLCFFSVVQVNLILFNRADQTNSSPHHINSIFLPRAAAPHDPINIHNESELLSFVSTEGIAGAGTENDPYLIENFEISAIDNESSAAISITDTISHITLNNIKIQHISEDSYYIWGIKLDNCSNSVLNEITINNITNEYSLDENYIFAISCYSSNHVSMQNIHIQNCVGDIIYHIDLYKTDQVNLNEILCEKSLAVNYTGGMSLYDSFNLHVQNFEFSNHTLNDPWSRVSNYIMCMYLSYCENVTIEKSVFYDLESQNTNMLGRIAESTSLLIQDNEWFNMQGNYFGFTITFTTDCIIRDNSFHDLQADDEANLFYCPNVVNANYFIANIVYDITSPVFYMFYFSSATDNIITENQLKGNNFGDYIRFAFLSGSAEENKFYYNFIFNSTLFPAYDHGTDNQWTVLTYFEPMQVMTMVGNYWCVHNVDEEGSLHYFVKNQYSIPGTANSNDTRPLHYFGLDQDEDGLITYYEQYYGFDANDPDSDNDGISDYDEINWMHGDQWEDDSTTTDTTEDDTSTNTDTTVPDTSAGENFWDSFKSDPGAIGTFSATLVLLVIAVQGFLKKKSF